MNKMIRILCFAALFILLLISSSSSQNNYFHYKFLNLQENRFRNIEDTLHYRNLMKKFSKSCHTDTIPVNILHMGDSHLQAGFYSNEIRKNFHHYFSNTSSANLGFIFPYHAAQTNNPGHYHTVSSGKWFSCRAVENNSCSQLGLSGINLKTRDTLATLKIKIKDYFPYLNYRIKKTELFCNYPDSTYNLRINGKPIQNRTDTNVTSIQFEQPVDSLTLRVRKIKTGDSSWFRLSGIVIKHKDRAINYHGIGVNGATARSYLKSDLMPLHLKNLQPDWVIISLGTNEAYSRKFNGQSFYRNLTKLITTIRKNTGNAWILLTTPGNSLREGKYKNPNNHIAREQIIRAANEFNCGYWDFYRIMGDTGAINHWSKENLTASDKLHLNKDGYQLKANLFFDAFLSNFHSFFAKDILNP